MPGFNSFARPTPFSGVSRFFRTQLYRWIDKRAKPATEHVLNQQRLYIFPTLRGQIFIVLIILLWLLGTNYQNNLILSLAFFLISLFIVTILHTYANLSGLTIAFSSSTSVFAGEQAEFIFTLFHAKHDIENLNLRWRDSEFTVWHIEVKKNAKTQVSVPVHAARRGWLYPGRLLVESEYPLGLIRCWTWLNWRAHSLVYPAPKQSPQPASIATAEEVGSEHHPIKGGEDFSHLVEYRPGDAIHHIAWKPFAQGKGLHIKEFSQTVSRENWLDYQTIVAGDMETKLSALCYWALQYNIADEHYGLRLPGKVISPDKGFDHKVEVLRTLAMFGIAAPNSGGGNSDGDTKR